MDGVELFRRTADEVLDELLEADPEWAVVRGDYRFDDRLTTRDAGELAAVRHRLERARQRLEDFPAGHLPAQDEADRAMLHAELDNRIFAITVLREHTWNPLAYNAGEALHPLLERESRPAGDRLRALAGRLAAVPQLVDTAIRQLTDVPKVHSETALGQLAGTMALVRRGVPRLLTEAPWMAGRVEPARQAAEAALERLGAHLQRLLDTGDADPRLGPAAFAEKLTRTLQSEVAADLVVGAARDRVAELHDRLYELARRYDGGQLAGALAREHGETGGVLPEAARPAFCRAVLDWIADDHPGDDTIVGLAERAMAECLEFTRAHDVVSVPDLPLRIELMPEFRRGVAVAYCDPAPPLDEHGGVSYVAIAPAPADWPEQRRTSFYRENNAAAMCNLMVHEAMPGHVLQLALAQRGAHPSRVRRALRSGSFVEGWAVYAEEVMTGEGFGGLPVALMQTKVALRVAINALLDAGVHAGGLEERDALALMTGDGFQEEGEAVGKWRRAQLTSAQLSTYFVGWLEVSAIAAAAPAELSARARHDAMLSHGSLPPRLLRRLVGW